MAAGKQRRWDMISSHSSVGVIIYHTSLDALLVVRQFRPPVSSFFSCSTRLTCSYHLFDFSLYPWPRPALPCPALPCPALPCPALPCPALPCPALLSCPASISPTAEQCKQCNAALCVSMLSVLHECHMPDICSMCHHEPLHTCLVQSRWP